MIQGNGDLASALKKLPKKNNILYFASGVSNSKETRESEYKREEDLLMSQPKDKHLVYFGSLCIYYLDTRYAKHKRQMEDLVKKHFDKYTIVRLGNITWGRNPNTIINFFKNVRRQGKEIEIQDTYRYVIDEEEFLHWISMIPDWNTEMNLTGQKLSIKEIVEKYVDKNE